MFDLGLAISVIIAALTFCGSAVVAFAIWRSNRHQVQQQKDMLNQRVWIDSAHLILKLWEKLYNDKDLYTACSMISHQETFETDDNLKFIRVKYLNHLTTVTSLYYDSVLTKQHVMSYFGMVLDELGAHKETVRYLWDPELRGLHSTIRQWLKENTNYKLSG